LNTKDVVLPRREDPATAIRPSGIRRSRPRSSAAIEILVQPSQLSVVFQPIVDLATGLVFGQEVLTRSRVPGYATPRTLFERAAMVGCSGRLGRMVRQLALPQARGTRLFVNVHPAELQEHWLVRPDDPLNEHDAPVYLEITEAIPFRDAHQGVAMLRELRKRAGVVLVVDDFGAGYSNLSRIRDLEPGIVKLDRELVHDLDRDPRGRRLVAAALRFCTDLGAQVVAEGIETPGELQVLRDLGVHYGQGYLLARPANPIPAVTWPPDRPGVDLPSRR
jgi:EAL domain-containing protein (putative c-di-GMP-specific phosphodiesterase class I)